VIGASAVIIAVFFLFWYTPFSPSALQWPYEWALVFSWIFLGILFLIASKVADRKKKITEAERELLMFGEEYARE
jgi:uncharacterized membrane protein